MMDTVSVMESPMVHSISMILLDSIWESIGDLTSAKMLVLVVDSTTEYLASRGKIRNMMVARTHPSHLLEVKQVSQHVADRGLFEATHASQHVADRGLLEATHASHYVAARGPIGYSLQRQLASCW